MSTENIPKPSETAAANPEPAVENQAVKREAASQESEALSETELKEIAGGIRVARNYNSPFREE